MVKTGKLGPKVLSLAIPFLPYNANPLKSIGKPLALHESVYKWKLCTREELSNWSHLSDAFTLLGDTAQSHALPSFRCRHVSRKRRTLDESLSRISSSSDIPLALSVYKACRKKRPTGVV